MFKASRDRLLDSAHFDAQGATVMEAWNFSSPAANSSQVFRHEFLQDNDVVAWLKNEGRFAPPVDLRPNSSLHGGIRLVLCDRTMFRPPRFAISRNTFLLIEDLFDLPWATLGAAFSEAGTYSCHHTYSATSNVVEKFRLVLKAKQKWEVANYVLSYSHDVASGITTGFIFGEKLFTYPHEATSQAAQILRHIDAGRTYWNHPTFLAVILLENHVARASNFLMLLDKDVVSLEQDTGLVFAGQLTNAKKRVPKAVRKRELHDLTVKTHTVLTQVVFLRGVIAWEEDCIDFLLTQLEILKSSLPHRMSIISMDLFEMVSFLRSTARGLRDSQTSWQCRVQSQIDAIFSFLAQIDNRLNSKVAVASNRDGAAMKILAVITTIFLPGTFVASLFSMSMFNWRTSPDSNPTETVSSTFWIYWVVTLPITFLVFIGWHYWWKRHDENFKNELEDAERIS